VNWSGPDATGDGGTFTARIEADWSGPQAVASGGTFTGAEAIDWSGPQAVATVGDFVATEAALWSGPAAEASGGSFSAREEANWSGPGAVATGGAFSARVEADWEGPQAVATGGTFTVLSNIAVDWEGPQAVADGGTFSYLKTEDPYRGTQYVEGALAFTGAATLELYASVYSIAGDYVVLDYTGGTFAGGQAELDARVTVVDVDLSDALALPASSGVTVLEDQPAQSRVMLHLRSSPTNGKQYVEGDLTFSGAMTVQLSEALYATAGVYELFEVTGTVTNLGNLTCLSTRGYTCTVSQVGNIIYVTLA
jgi:hypothetical protein